jgi:hypothetical protein
MYLMSPILLIKYWIIIYNYYSYIKTCSISNNLIRKHKKDLWNSKLLISKNWFKYSLRKQNPKSKLLEKISRLS